MCVHNSTHVHTCVHTYIMEDMCTVLFLIIMILNMIMVTSPQ